MTSTTTYPTKLKKPKEIKEWQGMINEVICGDGTKGIKLIPNECADLVVLDPNYQDWDMLCLNGLIEDAKRILSPTGNILCFTKQPFDFELRKCVYDIFRREIIWSFNNGGAWVSNKMPLVSFQKIYWLTPNDDFFFNERSGVSYNEKTKSTKRKNKVFGGYKAEGKEFVKSDEGTWVRDHYHFEKPLCGEIPAKPEELMEILLQCFCPAGGLVVDPFMGSGTTARAAKNLGMDFIGLEIRRDYCRYIEQRLQQLNLF
jgi:site-specific DNA-methyltransferase (adenine-specific)